MPKENVKPRPARLPSLDALRVFEVAARRMRFTEAAHELSVTQSAVSKQVKSLEQDLGVALFRRFNRRLELTEAGHVMHRAASQMVQTVTEAVHAVSQARETAPLTVTTTIAFASLWLVPRLPDFRAHHPDIEVRLAADNHYRDLEREQIDVAVRFGIASMFGPDDIPLSGEAVFPVCTPALARTLRKPDDLARHVFLHYEEANRLWPELGWTQWLTALGVPHLEPQASLTFSQYDHLIAAALESQGVAIGRARLLDRYLEQGSLVAPFSKRAGRVSMARRYGLVVSAAARNKPSVNAFCRWIEAQAAHPLV
jgi:LysR family transcriptional regulator, glycine cleavage system transcriptional activator